MLEFLKRDLEGDIRILNRRRRREIERHDYGGSGFSQAVRLAILASVAQKSDVRQLELVTYPKPNAEFIGL